MSAFSVIIPARYASTRLPGKVLCDIHGKTMVQHVYERAIASEAAQVVVATDSVEIAAVVHDFGGEVCLTATTHLSGTERVAEAVALLGIGAEEIVVNVQADEPFISPQAIHQVAAAMNKAEMPDMATLCHALIQQEDIANPNIVKVVCNQAQKALYFSRAMIPYQRDWEDTDALADIGAARPYFRHIGIYAYRADFLARYLAWSPCALEVVEKLEQLRVLWHGGTIHVECFEGELWSGVDTEEDLMRARACGGM